VLLMTCQSSDNTLVKIVQRTTRDDVVNGEVFCQSQCKLSWSELNQLNQLNAKTMSP
jgi:hypothetical protein